MLNMLGIALFLVTTSGSTNTNVEPLELKVQLKSDTLTMRSVLTFEIEVVNIGTAPIVFFDDFRWGLGGTLKFRVRTQKGTPVPNRLIIDNDVPTGVAESEPPTVIAPGSMVKNSQSFYVDSLVREPGNYILLIEYRAPKVEAEDRDLDFQYWTRESGPLVGSAEFTVTR